MDTQPMKTRHIDNEITRPIHSVAGLNLIPPNQANDSHYRKSSPAENQSGANDITHEPAGQYPIAIYTLGHFSLFKHGTLLNENGTGQHKPHELLKLLIALGGRSVGEIRISDALWPEADGDVAHTSFSVTLHRIRKLMGIKAIHLNDGHLSLDASLCWVDVWELQKTIGQIKDIIHSTSINVRSVYDLTCKAIDLYHGHFLGNEDEQPWFIAFREKLKNKFIRNLLLACDYLESQGRCDLAMDFYRKGIEVDQLSEEFYLRLMKCYASHGRKVEAIGVYQQCHKVFNALTGCDPSADTENQYQLIQNSI